MSRAIALLTLFVCVSAATAVWARTIPTDPASMKQAAAIYQQKCASCHGIKGKGDGPAARILTTKPVDFTTGEYRNGSTDEAIFKSIAAGVPRTQMAGFKGRLTDDEIACLVGYLKSMKP